MSNEDLAIAIQAGDESRIAELWDQVKRFVYREVNRYIVLAGLNAQMKEDLRQSGFLAVHAAAYTFKQDCEAGFLTWLKFYLKTEFRRALGASNDRQKNDPLHRASSLDIPVSEDEEETLYEIIPGPDVWTGVNESMWRRQAHNAIQEILDRLPADQASVITKHYYQGMSKKEIAAEMGMRREDVQLLEDKAMRIFRSGRAFLMLRALVDDTAKVAMPAAFSNGKNSVSRAGG